MQEVLERPITKEAEVPVNKDKGKLKGLSESKNLDKAIFE